MSNLQSNKPTFRNGGYFGPKETPYGAVLSAQEKQMAAVIVHLQVSLFAEMRYCQRCIWLNCKQIKYLQYLGKEGILCELHVAGGDPVQPAPDHGGGEDQHLLPLNASKQVAALIHFTIHHM